MDIGSKLKSIRLKNKYTQEEMAEELNVTRQTISNWELNKSYPDIISIIKLSEVYDVTLDELLKGDDKMIDFLNESINTVKSNKNTIYIFLFNIIFMFFISLLIFIKNNTIILLILFSAVLLTTSILFYKMIKNF